MESASGARWVNVVIGAWLFVSAFAWAHTPSQFMNTWIVGLAAVTSAAFTTRNPQLRYGNVVLAVWLFISIWALPTLPAAFWNNLIVSIVMFFAALVPGAGPTVTRRPPPKVGSPRVASGTTAPRDAHGRPAA